MKDLPHLAARLYGAPLLIARPKLEAILAALGPRLLGLASAPAMEARPKPQPDVLDSGIAILPILGTLVHRSAYLDAASGLMSYAEIVEAAAVHPDACHRHRGLRRRGRGRSARRRGGSGAGR